MNISQADIDQFVEAAAVTVMKNDRELYDIYFAAFEKYAIDNRLTYTLISAARSIVALKKNSGDTIRPAYDSYFITSSSSRPEDDARAVANIIMSIKPIADLPKRVTLAKDASGWMVTINGRGCFKITADMKYRGKNVDDIIGHEKGRGLWTGGDVLCQNIYGVCAYLLSQMYDPLRVVPVEMTMKLLVELLPIIPGGGIVGGRGGHHKKATPAPAKPKMSQIIESLDGVYLVGTRRGNLPVYMYDGSFDVIRKALPKSFRVAAYSLHDYDDFALTKYIIHDSDDRAVAVFYDSLERQMVPIFEGRTVSFVYAARAIILEMQMLMLMAHLGKNMTGMIRDLSADLHELMKRNIFDDDGIIGYAGAAVNWMILRREQGGFFGVFYPNNDGTFDRNKKGSFEADDGW